MLHSLDVASADTYAEVLRGTRFFTRLNADDIRLLASLCYEESHPAGTVLFEEGQEAEKFFIVWRGSVEVWKNYGSDAAELLAVHGPGQLFGEMALIDDLPRSATLRAREDTDLLYILKGDFSNVIRNHNEIAMAVMRSMSLMMRASNELFAEDLRKRNLELERANRDLQAAQAEIVRVERLSTLGKFASIIIHDIRNPISALTTHAQLILLNKEDPDKIDKYINSLLNELARLERLSSELLDYSRGEIRLRPSPVDISELFERLRESLSERFKAAKIALDIEARFRGPVIMDYERMLRVFLNIADNARKAMLAGGSFTARCERSGDEVEFSFIDSGEGMDEETLSRVFEPFYSSSKQGGTGLGMLIVKNIVEAHEGSIHISSRKGGGTEVRLRIPYKFDLQKFL
jgi:signal transduction histidine kinase